MTEKMNFRCIQCHLTHYINAKRLVCARTDAYCHGPLMIVMSPLGRGHTHLTSWNRSRTGSVSCTIDRRQLHAQHPSTASRDERAVITPDLCGTETLVCLLTRKPQKTQSILYAASIVRATILPSNWTLTTRLSNWCASIHLSASSCTLVVLAKSFVNVALNINNYEHRNVCNYSRIVELHRCLSKLTFHGMAEIVQSILQQSLYVFQETTDSDCRARFCLPACLPACLYTACVCLSSCMRGCAAYCPHLLDDHIHPSPLCRN